MTQLLDITTPLTTAQIQQFRPELITLQGNILKGHGRRHAHHIFLSFTDGRVADVKSWLGRFVRDITSASDQVGGIRSVKPFVSLSLSADGYRYFGKQLGPKFDIAFVVGMKENRSILGDPQRTQWDVDHPGPIHAMVVLAHDVPNSLKAHKTTLLADLRDAASIAFIEEGVALRDDANPEVSYEHFGYVDGVSQPIFFADDIAKKQPDGVNNWNPAAGPRDVLVRDPLDLNGGVGSYLVFRKLEQKVAAFWRFRRQLSVALQINDDDRAGALALGRTENGMPLVGATVPPGTPPHRINNFNYGSDPQGLRCPLHAHIRKMNPRGSSIQTEGHRIVRRGIPYGLRLDPKANLDTVEDTGRGLLFMCYQKSITGGFEVLQGQWSNEEGFPAPGAGPDSIVGQPAHATSKTWEVPNVTPITLPFRNFVDLKGGAYFFTPSTSFLTHLSTES